MSNTLSYRVYAVLVSLCLFVPFLIPVHAQIFEPSSSANIGDLSLTLGTASADQSEDVGGLEVNTFTASAVTITNQQGVVNHAARIVVAVSGATASEIRSIRFTGIAETTVSGSTFNIPLRLFDRINGSNSITLTSPALASAPTDVDLDGIRVFAYEDDASTLVITESFDGGDILSDEDSSTLLGTVAKPFVTGILWVYETFGTYIVIGGFIVLLAMYGRRWFSMRNRRRI